MTGAGDLLDAARELAPRLRAGADATARRGVHDQPTHRALVDRGLYAMLVPERFGGAGLGLPPFAAVLAELAAACPVTARGVAELAAGAAVIGESFGEQAQEELHRRRPARTASAVAGVLRARPDGDGWILEGTLRLGAAARHATHLLVPAADGDTELIAVLGAQQLAVAGDGAAELEPTRVEGGFAAPGAADGAGATAVVAVALAAVLAGAARGASAEVQGALERDEQRAQDPDWQRRLGAAVAHAQTAELLLGQSWSRPGEPLRVAMLARESMRYGHGAVEVLLRDAGRLPDGPRTAIERIAAAAQRALHDPALPSEESEARAIARDRLGLS